MTDIIEGAGIFLYPLALCCLLAIFVFVERLVVLRSSSILPRDLLKHFVSGDLLALSGDQQSVAGRILAFFQSNKPKPDALKAYASMEISRLERGLFVLDIVAGIAPLLGLLGTVTGLVQVFSNINLESSMPEQDQFLAGIALALTTTMLGLMVAIPALVGSIYLNRRVDVFTAQLSVGVERLIDLARK